MFPLMPKGEVDGKLALSFWLVATNSLELMSKPMVGDQVGKLALPNI